MADARDSRRVVFDDELPRTSEAFLQALLDSLSAHIAVLDESGRIVAVNRAWRRFGEEQLCCWTGWEGVDYLEVCDAASGADADVAQAAARGIREILAGARDELYLEYPCHSPDEKRWFALRATRFAAPGRPRVVVAHETITRRRLAEEEAEALARQQAALSELGRHALAYPDLPPLLGEAARLVQETLAVDCAVVFELLPEAEVLRPAAAAGWEGGRGAAPEVGTGTRSQEGYALFRGEPVVAADLTAEERFTPARLVREAGWAAGASAVVEGLARPFGVLSAYARPSRGFGSSEVRFLQGVADLLAQAIERHRAEQRTRELAREQAGRTEAEVARERIAATLESITDAFLSVDRDWRLTYVNRRAEQILGKSREELVGRNLWQEFPHAPDSTVVRESRRAMDEGVTVAFEELYPDTGTWLEAYAYPARDGLSIYFRDVTAHKRALREAQEAVGARDEVLRVVSHDLRSPLHTIMMSTDVLLGSDLPVGQERQLQIIRRATERMSRLLQDLLEVARVEAGRLSLHREHQDPALLAYEAVELSAPLAAAKPLALEVVEVAAGVPPVFADRDRVLQVLSNLLGNAIKFTPSGGRVTVGLAAAGDEVRFTVEDTGPGIPEEQLAQLFRPFWQARRGSREGAGLGLAIARGLVEAHGGRIWAESEVGVGTTLTFTLPVAQERRPA